ncbi:putative btb poz domain containing protein [Diplodia seriata]|uniref:Putative btb poz domain containing protein n=1 Tax=Diplodia seriata TaxID=420778 RepID=A0A0G2G8Q8_9PEZI|nr:putative btb poz domain containing protein [Diplodia seriata]
MAQNNAISVTEADKPGWVAGDATWETLWGEVELDFNQGAYADKTKALLFAGPDAEPFRIDEKTLNMFCPHMTRGNPRDPETNALDIDLPQFSPRAVLFFIWWCYDGHCSSPEDTDLEFSSLALAEISVICQSYRLYSLEDWMKQYAQVQFFEEYCLYPKRQPRTFVISLQVVGLLWEISDDSNCLRAVYTDFLAHLMPLTVNEDGSKAVKSLPPGTRERVPRDLQAMLESRVQTRIDKGNRNAWEWGLDLPEALIKYAFLSSLQKSQKAVLKYIATKDGTDPSGLDRFL